MTVPIAPGDRPLMRYIGEVAEAKAREAGMRLSTKGRYAVMAMVDLASSGKGGPIALADIAERQEISLS